MPRDEEHNYDGIVKIYNHGFVETAHFDHTTNLSGITIGALIDYYINFSVLNYYKLKYTPAGTGSTHSRGYLNNR